MQGVAKVRLLLPTLVFAAAVVAGCGSSSSSSSSVAAASSSSPSSPSSTTASTSTTAASGAGSSASGGSIEITTKHDKKLGTILAAGKNELTVYLFEADQGGQSACSGECAKFWPPVTGTAKASDKAKAGELGTITRADGSTQVTYKGHPLYYFVKDKDDGDAYGQGSKQFGAGWYVLSANGNKIDES